MVLDGNKGDKFFDEDYILPDDLNGLNNKIIKIKFTSDGNTSTAKIFSIRLLK